MNLLRHLRVAASVLFVLTILTGLVYPLVVTGLAQALFPRRANGSVLVVDGRAVGSELIGQAFVGERYFWGRPSATSSPYDAAASGGSNLGPTNPALHARVAAAVEQLRAAHPHQAGSPPVDLVTASGSGLDPHLSPAAAAYQVERVAAARHLEVEQVRRLVAEHTAGRDLGVLGEPRVAVLALNLALDRLPDGRP